MNHVLTAVAHVAANLWVLKFTGVGTAAAFEAGLAGTPKLWKRSMHRAIGLAACAEVKAYGEASINDGTLTEWQMTLIRNKYDLAAMHLLLAGYEKAVILEKIDLIF